ncbi:hypothetical protein SAMN05880501_10659 [Ureibacillus xyleni]|uniref:Calcineurin-like phosphoesterase domain-containing protein n=1 Tax=Ureibacillus xyleni TaxID=614648 RepID=A0A285SRS1_9BACL|nr:metallophosphoesterase [Ureibacillus xyleni]SOC10942.1 hypothetical protein SAMN05880501_10659 [Ureibacillus xyleni]
MGKVASIIIAVLIYGSISAYLGWNFKKWLESIHIFRWPVLYWMIVFLVAFSPFLGRVSWLSPFSVIGNYWMFFFEYGLIICIVVNIIIFLTPLKNVTIIGSVAVGLLVILFGLGTYNAYSPVTRHLDISINKSGEPLRLVVASDFHLGILSNKGHLQRFVDLANEAKPDAVLLVGDLVDDDPIWFVEDGMDQVMKQLRATYGVYGVLGNHEYYGGKIPLFVEEMKGANVQILMDETILVGDRFYLTGQEDATNKKRKAIAELKPSDEEYPWIVMNHTPYDLELPQKAGADLHLSGHTHLGQLWPNNFITNKIFELDYGHMEKGSMHTLVSSGFGFWGPPMRIGSRSELWIVDINFTGEGN